MKKALNPAEGNLSLLRDVERTLERGGVECARFEAENLLRHYGRADRIELFTGAKQMGAPARLAVKRAVKKRLTGRPLAHILGEADFYGRPFFVTPDALIPRPETELLVEQTARLVRDLPEARILDLGTGTGCIAVSLTLLCPDCRMTALDVSPKALKIARKNLKRHGLSKSIELVRGDLFSGFGENRKHSWDLIVSNPPYIAADEVSSLPREVRREPRVALVGGKKGTEIASAILEKAPDFLRPGGFVAMEIGDGQSAALTRRFGRGGAYESVQITKDHLGVERILIARRKR